MDGSFPHATPATHVTPAAPAEAPPRADRAGAWLALGGALVAITFALDVVTGSDFAFSLFYLVPIAVVAWRVGLRPGILASLASAGAWLLASQWTGLDRTRPEVLAWNTAMQAGFFVVVAWALSALRAGLARERHLRAQLAQSVRALDHELASVGDLQRALLPARPPSVRGFEFAVHYATSTRAGGDYYDFFALDGARVGILLADVSGHGAPASVVMAMLRTILRTSSPPLDAPDALLRYANRALVANVPPAQFVTACYAVLDPDVRTIEFSLAGHMPPLLAHAAGETGAALEELALCGGPPLGLFGEARYPGARARLCDGDSLLFYTDGLHEAMDGEGRLLGLERVRAALVERRARCAEAIKDGLLDEVTRHRGGAPLADDLTLLVVRALVTRAAAPLPPRLAKPDLGTWRVGP